MRGVGDGQHAGVRHVGGRCRRRVDVVLRRHAVPEQHGAQPRIDAAAAHRRRLRGGKSWISIYIW